MAHSLNGTRQTVVPGTQTEHRYASRRSAISPHPRNVFAAPPDDWDDECQAVDDHTVREQAAKLEHILPDADPEFLLKCVRLIGGSGFLKMNAFLTLMLDKDGPGYPTRRGHYAKRLLSADLQRRYVDEFHVADFVREFEDDDPVTFYDNPDRKGTDALYCQWARAHLRSVYPNVSLDAIDQCFKKNKSLFAPTLTELSYQSQYPRGPVRRTPSNDSDPLPETPCVEFMKERAFVHHQVETRAWVAQRRDERELSVGMAQMFGELQVCSICADDGLLIAEMHPCSSSAAHRFCAKCIQRHVTAQIAVGRSQVPCMSGDCCDGDFAIAALSDILRPTTFEKLTALRQIDDIAAANLCNLRKCPFCPYAVIVDDPSDTVFRCLRPSCGRESCALCREASHIPQSCAEVAQARDRRTYAENRLSEAMIRKCHKCQRGITKDEGCNKVTCVCEATMCYVCRKPNIDYSHFKPHPGPGDCLLHSDAGELHAVEVAREEERLAREMSFEPPAATQIVPADHVMASYDRPVRPNPSAPAAESDTALERYCARFPEPYSVQQQHNEPARRFDHVQQQHNEPARRFDPVQQQHNEPARRFDPVQQQHNEPARRFDNQAARNMASDLITPLTLSFFAQLWLFVNLVLILGRFFISETIFDCTFYVFNFIALTVTAVVVLIDLDLRM